LFENHDNVFCEGEHAVLFDVSGLAVCVVDFLGNCLFIVAQVNLASRFTARHLSASGQSWDEWAHDFDAGFVADGREFFTCEYEDFALIDSSVLDVCAEVFFINALHDGVDEAGKFWTASNLDDFAGRFCAVMNGCCGCEFERIEHVLLLELEVASFDDLELVQVRSDCFEE